jgi:hypothetical protein
VLHPVENPDQFVVGGLTLGYRLGSAEWEIGRDDIVCVGEATTESPTSGEDWLICLVTDTHGTWVEASLYSQGRNDALQWLSNALSSSMEVKLAHAPPYRSRVMWPPEMKERPLFEYQVSPLRRAFSRGLRRLGFEARGGVQTVHPGVLDYLWRNRHLIGQR